MLAHSRSGLSGSFQLTTPAAQRLPPVRFIRRVNINGHPLTQRLSAKEEEDQEEKRSEQGDYNGDGAMSYDKVPTSYPPPGYSPPYPPPGGQYPPPQGPYYPPQHQTPPGYQGYFSEGQPQPYGYPPPYGGHHHHHGDHHHHHHGHHHNHHEDDCCLGFLKGWLAALCCCCILDECCCCCF